MAPPPHAPRAQFEDILPDSDRPLPAVLARRPLTPLISKSEIEF
jgi:hypothetical protein